MGFLQIYYKKRVQQRKLIEHVFIELLFVQRKYIPIISAVGLFCYDKFEETINEKVVNMSKLTKSYFSCRAQIVVSKYIRGVVRTLFRHSLFNLANCIFANWDKCILLRRIYLVFFFFLIKIIANNYCFVWYNYSYCSQLQKRNDYQFNYQ